MKPNDAIFDQSKDIPYAGQRCRAGSRLCTIDIDVSRHETSPYRNDLLLLNL